MGIDLKDRGRTIRSGRKVLVSKNPYMRLLYQLYTFLSRRTDSNFNGKVVRRLRMCRRCRPPLCVSRLVKLMRNKDEKIAVVIGPVTDDIRSFKMKKMRVCALRFTEGARKRIVEAGGECLTLDQLALISPKGNDCILLQGARKARAVEKHFGKAPGVPHSHAKPYVRSEGRKFGRARNNLFST